MARNWYNADGSLNTALLDELEASMKAVTDNTGRLMDQAAGKGMLPVFRCGHSGLLYPPNYVKDWGKLFGIGLGPDVCSEALDSDYDTAPPEVDSSIKRITQIMHGVRVCKAQMDMDWVTPEEWNDRTTVLHQDDLDYEERAPILLEKQLQKSGALKALYAEWERRNGPVNLSQVRR